MKHIFPNTDIEVYNFPFIPIDSRMYLLIDKQNIINEAVIIDPCINMDALAILNTNEVQSLIVLLTHEHYDHISGVNWLREKLKDVEVICSKSCSERIKKPNKNLSLFYDVLFMLQSEDTRQAVKDLKVEPYSCIADSTFEGNNTISWNSHSIVLYETPGHSPGSICVIVDDILLFSGDSIVNGKETITRLPGGNSKAFAEMTVPFLNSLNQDMIVFPGHGDPDKLKNLICGVYKNAIKG